MKDMVFQFLSTQYMFTSDGSFECSVTVGVGLNDF